MCRRSLASHPDGVLKGQQRAHSAGQLFLETVLLVSRAATDTGRRTGLDEVIAAFGFDRGELEAELDADLATGRE